MYYPRSDWFSFEARVESSLADSCLVWVRGMYVDVWVLEVSDGGGDERALDLLLQLLGGGILVNIPHYILQLPQQPTPNPPLLLLLYLNPQKYLQSQQPNPPT